ncbi:MAG: hypothetical protein OQL06_10575 [Gammaproteobacteria bacterium]|nr:hypothetical protein [Gammaproteobacteria bacterium]
MKYVSYILLGIFSIFVLSGCKSMDSFVPRTELFGYKSGYSLKDESGKYPIEEGHDFKNNDVLGVKPGTTVNDFSKAPDRRLNLRILESKNKSNSTRYIHKKPYDIKAKPNELVFVGTVGIGENKTVYYVQRLNDYSRADLRPLTDKFLKTLKEKYGPESITIHYEDKRGNGSMALFWAYTDEGLLISPKYYAYNFPHNSNKSLLSYMSSMGYVRSPEFPIRLPEKDSLMTDKIALVSTISISDLTDSDCAIQGKPCKRMMSANIKFSNRDGQKEVSSFSLTLADMDLFNDIQRSVMAKLRSQEENNRRHQLEKQKKLDVEL